MREDIHAFFLLFLDIFEIKGKLTELPYSAYANFSASDIWTFTFNAASPMVVVKPLLALIAVFFMMA